jgi:cytochrome b
MMKGGQARPAVRVWDRFVRIAHWTLVATVAGAWLTQDGGGRWHEWLGYAAWAVVIARIAWGCVGSSYARFRQFVKPPAATLHYVQQVLRRAEPRHLGHNPLGAYMIMLLMLMVILVSASGWLMTTDAFWGIEWVEDLHEAMSDVLVALVILHVSGVVFTSLRQHENLVAAMLHGFKRPPEDRDVA